jgi:hypothetical protein
MPASPSSITSRTLAGCSTGIEAACRMPSVWCGYIDDCAAWSSPVTASTPPSAEVPIMFAVRNTSPVRSTPGPLPYQMPNTPSTRVGP